MVITDTATTTGYRKSPITPSDRPREAMINENSPICAIENPHRIADFSDSPPSMKEKEPKIPCPIRIVITSMKMGKAYSTSISGSTSIPTETKKIAPKRFFTGSTSLMIFSASMVSARMLPMIKAPKADEKPTFVDITAIAQHRPSDTIRSTSLLMRCLTLLRNNGMAKIPTTSHSTRKNTIFITLPSISPPPSCSPLAMALNSTIITMARISSRMSTLITRPANCCWRSPRSSNALYMMVVEDIASIPPRKIQSIFPHPKRCPTMTPSIDMKKIVEHVVMIGDAPILRIFLKEKSSPNENRRNITPRSDHRWMLSESTTDAVYGMWGLTRNPATT